MPKTWYTLLNSKRGEEKEREKKEKLCVEHGG